MNERERREWALAGGEPPWRGVESAAAPQRAVPAYESQAPPDVEQLRLF